MLRSIHSFFRGRFEKFYSKSHWHLVLDLSLTIVVICLLIISAALYFYRPSFLSNLPGFGYYVSPTVDLNNPPLSLNFFPSSGVVSLNEPVDLKITFKNNGTAAVSNLKITLTTDDNFSIEKIEPGENASGFNINNQIIIFSKIPAGGSGEADFKISFGSAGKERIINWLAKSEYNYGGQTLHGQMSLTALKVKAELIVDDAAYFTSPQGDQLGIGPIPPFVGIPTNLWIFLEAQSGDDWENLIVSARLPKGVSLTNSRSLLAGNFNYSTSTRQIIWKVPDLIGRTEGYHMGFEIQIIPTTAQVGEVLSLLENVQYYATDSLTGEEIGGTLDKLTTDLDKDRFNSGQGKVVNE